MSYIVYVQSVKLVCVRETYLGKNNKRKNFLRHIVSNNYSMLLHVIKCEFHVFNPISTLEDGKYIQLIAYL